MHEPAGIEPLAPFGIVLAGSAVHEIAGVKCQRCPRRAPPSLADHARIQALDRVLRVAEVQERKRSGRGGGRTATYPLAPPSASSDTIGVQRIGLEVLQPNMMLARNPVFRNERRAPRADLACVIREIRLVERFRNLQ